MADRSETIECPSCHAPVPLPAKSWWRGWRPGWWAIGVGLLAVAGIVYRYLGQIRTLVLTLDQLTGSTGWSWFVLLAAVLVLICLIAWLLLPILLVVIYLDQRRRGRNWLGSAKAER